MNSKYKGILYIITAAFFFALMNLFVRLAGDLPSIQKSFFRNFVAMIFAGGMLLKARPSLKLDKGSWGILLLRAIFGTLGILCNFYAIDHLVLADATMLNKMSPFFAILLSVILLKEKISLFQGCAVAAAFGGVLMVIQPSGSNLDVGPALIGLFGGMFAGIAYTMVRLLGKRGVAGPFIVFFFSAFSCAATLPSLILQFTPMTAAQLVILLLAGASAAAAQFSITAAYCHAPAREISIYDYSQIVFAAILGFVFLHQVPDALSLAGYGVICAAALANFLYSTRLSRRSA